MTRTDGKPYVERALEFLRTCASATPLKKFAPLFEPANATGELRECLEQGLWRFSTDLERWGLGLEPPEELFDRLLLAPNLQATYLYRVCHELYLREIRHLPDVIAALSRFSTGVQVYYSATIGPGLKVIHGHGTLIGAGCTIGSCFTVYQNVTVGDRLGKQTGKRPVIGDYVIASAGAQIVGPVTVGSRCIVGANSLVLHSVPDNSITAGVPAKVRLADLGEEQFGEFWAAIKG